MKKRILCYGDSNTWGYNGAKGGERFDEDIRWTGRLQKLLGDDYVIIEEAQNGRTTVWDDPVEKRMSGLTYLWPCMESQSPFDLIIIMLGVNDTKIYFNVRASHIARSAMRLVKEAVSSGFGPGGTNPQVLLVSPIRVKYHESIKDSFGQQAVEKSEAFAEAFRTRMKEEGINCHFMDAAEFAEPGPADGLHLDEEGHAALAQAFCDKIHEIFDR